MSLLPGKPLEISHDGILLGVPLRFYENNNPKELLSRITTDISSISNLVMKVFLPIFTTAYASFGPRSALP